MTSPARTLIDLAGRYKLKALERILDEGLIERRFGLVELNTCVQRATPNTPGWSKIERLLTLRSEGPAADSILEARCFEALPASRAVRGPLRNRCWGRLCTSSMQRGRTAGWQLKSSAGRTELRLVPPSTGNGAN